MAPERFRGTGWLHERPTLDVIVLIFTIVVAVVMVGAVATVAVLELMDHNIDTTEIVGVIDGQVGTILGALLGLIAGQASGRRNNSEPYETNSDKTTQS